MSAFGPRLAALALLAAAACNGFDESASTPESRAKAAARARPTPRAKASDKTKATEPDPDLVEATEPGTPKGGGPPTVLFIVMDTVRAKNLSLCGYDRPTSPVLESLRDELGAAWTCEAYSADTWTVPSHASYFTGKSVPEHESDSMGFTFSEEFPTLSEIMKSKGYQPVMLSANPTLSKESGLQRGFEIIDRATTLVEIRGDDVSRRTRTVLDKVDPDKPLFFFVNLLDAHDPYPRVPPNVGWVPPRPELAFDVLDPERDQPYHRYIRGEMSPERSAEYLAAIRDGYDYGISLADRNVGEVLKILRNEGWLANGYRLVITSDHGEFLGEHRLLRHGCFVWEPVTRVPFLFYDSSADKQITLPSPFSAINSFWLVSEGKLPSTPTPVAAFSKRRKLDVKVGADMAALWLPGGEKLIWNTDAFYQYDLAADPEEAGKVPLSEAHPARAELERMAEAHAEHLVRIRGLEADPEMLKQMAALGYVE